MFVYLFRVLRPTRQFFTQMETSPLLVEGCKVLTTEWPLSSEGSLRRLVPVITRIKLFL